MLFYSKSKSWKSVGGLLDEVADEDELFPELAFKRVLLLPVLLSALGNEDPESFGVVLLQFSPISVELDEDTSTRGGTGLWLSVDSPLASCELEVAWGNAFDWLGLVFGVLDGKPNENWFREDRDDDEGLGWLQNIWECKNCL